MDTFIAQAARDNRLAARQFLALRVERVVNELGLMRYFLDEAGHGPYIHEVLRQREES